jgi:inorganic phosphate transporter, PiT family
LSAAIIFVAVLFVAYTNGANDNFKGVATLYGSGTASYRVSLAWTTVFSFLGAAASVLLAMTLVKRFSGHGLVPDDIVRTYPFVVAVALGTGLTVMLASRVGMPVSTTHAIAGGLIGAGLAAAGGQVGFSTLGKSFLLPLALSPVLAAALSVMLYSLLHAGRRSLGVRKELCVCAAPDVALVPSGAAAASSATTRIIVTDADTCDARYHGKLFGVAVERSVRRAHFLSAATVCFSRGLNDAPKLAGLLLILHPAQMSLNLVGIASAMALGGVLNARRVAQTLSKNITPMNQGQALCANLVTGALVAAASWFGLPVSTTHVSVGALLGIGAKTGAGNRRVISQIFMAWLFTLPAGGLAGALLYLLITRLFG